MLTRLRAIATARSGAGQAPVLTAQRISTASHEQMFRALRDRNQRLHQENKQLRNELAVALGQLRDLRRGAPTSPRS